VGFGYRPRSFFRGESPEGGDGCSLGVGNGVREKTERGEKEESERERGLERALTGREREA